MQWNLYMSIEWIRVCRSALRTSCARGFYIDKNKSCEAKQETAREEKMSAAFVRAVSALLSIYAWCIAPWNISFDDRTMCSRKIFDGSIASEFFVRIYKARYISIYIKVCQAIWIQVTVIIKILLIPTTIFKILSCNNNNLKSKYYF